MRSQDIREGAEYAFCSSGSRKGEPRDYCQRVTVLTKGYRDKIRIESRSSIGFPYYEERDNLLRVKSEGENCPEFTAEARQIVMPWPEYEEYEATQQAANTERQEKYDAEQDFIASVNLRLRAAGYGHYYLDGREVLRAKAYHDVMPLVAPLIDGIPEPTSDEIGYERHGSFWDYLKTRR